MDTIILVAIVAAAAITIGFLFGLIIGRSTTKEDAVGELIVATDGEDYTMRLDIDRSVTGVQPEEYIMSRERVALDVHPIRIK